MTATRARAPTRATPPGSAWGAATRTAASRSITCYKAHPTPGTTGFIGRDVTLVDQFESRPAHVGFRFCTPVSKNGEAVPDATAHLTCYHLDDLSTEPPTPRSDVTVQNQFGDFPLTVRPVAPLLCVSSLKNS